MQSSKSVTITTLQELDVSAKQLLEFAGNNRVIAFYGQMGAGKTTLISAVCKHLGVIVPTSSPTYSIVNEYVTQNGEKIYHFDFYRLASPAEAYDMGYEEYLYSGNYCFMEWPEKLGALLPNECVKVAITLNKNKRIILFEL